MTANFEVTGLDGKSAGLTGTLVIPGSGQAARFLNQIAGLESLPRPFQGVLRVTAPAGVSVVGLRGRYNERGDFLITTTPPFDESAAPSNAESLFPHFADAGGYTTQFVLFSGASILGRSTSLFLAVGPARPPAVQVIRQACSHNVARVEDLTFRFPGAPAQFVGEIS